MKITDVTTVTRGSEVVKNIPDYSFFTGELQERKGLFYKLHNNIAFLGNKERPAASWDFDGHVIHDYRPVEVQEIIIKEKV